MSTSSSSCSRVEKLKGSKMKLLLILLLLSCQFSFAEEGHDHKETEKPTEHKDDHDELKLPSGVTSFEDESGEFSLKPNVIKNFGISHSALTKKDNSIKVPADAVVRSLSDTTIFTFRNGRFRSIKVTVIKSEAGFSFINTNENLTGLEIVTKGNNFLKTILLSLEEGPSEGHGH